VALRGLLAERVCFSFSGAFKTYTNSWEGRPRRFPPNEEPVGRGMSGSQPGEGGLGHPWGSLHKSQTFSTSSLHQKHPPSAKCSIRHKRIRN
jgi:hypothetical protein